ncbi:MAG: proline dehydrogenase family protein [Planctomycetes bacterium]|nr:proline dehydrogenase family protein [Planctomycetota bacterium]MCB9868899.1 proline dehydrogenase family protein [Planctomycetota bacterium]
MNPLIRFIPPPLVRFFARPYVAGDSLEKAIDVAAKMVAEDGFLTTLDLLAEGIDSAAAVRQNVDTYLRMVDVIADDPRFAGEGRRPTVSLKFSSYTTAPLEAGGDASGAEDAVRRIVEHAARRGVEVTLDMESRHWTDYTLACLARLHQAGHRHVGCVIQTRLHRSEADLRRLPAGCRVRLVIGIYHEPEEVALTDKSAMKDRMLLFAGRLLEAGHYVEFATHDERYVARFLDEVAPGVGADRYEVQMLYGVPRVRLQKSLVAQGVRVRLYVPFALSWKMAVAYLRRRLDEYPAMAVLVAKNWLRRR